MIEVWGFNQCKQIVILNTMNNAINEIIYLLLITRYQAQRKRICNRTIKITDQYFNKLNSFFSWIMITIFIASVKSDNIVKLLAQLEKIKLKLKGNEGNKDGKRSWRCSVEFMKRKRMKESQGNGSKNPTPPRTVHNHRRGSG